MSSSVEDEIVSMKFDNTQFEKAVSTSIGTLDKLKKSLVMPANGMSNGLSEVSKSMRGFHMNPLVDAASEVGRAFSSMSVVAITAIATIATQATQAALGIAKSLTIAPITQGFSEYETQIGSIQTILANTGLEGQKGLDKVNTKLKELNDYSDKTIYNFSEMARNIGTFTAAGVDLDTSTEAIKGIANLAAVSGSNSQQASTAMYQLSQALAAGSVKLMDWNSVVNAGMGGKVFKDALMETARVSGIAIDDMIAKDGSFRETLQEGWLTSEVLTKTLAKFTGDLSKEQLLNQGYTKKQADEILKLGAMANDAASKVKTLSQLMGTLKEAVGSGWAQTWGLVFGDFNEARTLFSAVSDELGGYIKASADHRNSVLSDWKALGGRTKLISAIGNAWKALLSVLRPIHEAFRDIFPAATGKQLKDLTKALNQFFRHLRLTADAQEDLKNTFAGLFAVMHIAFTIIKGVAHVLATLVGLFFKSQGSTLAFTGGIGQMLVALDAFLTKGRFIENFFDALAFALKGILGPLVDVKNLLVGGLVDLFTGDPAAFFDSISASVLVLLNLVDNLSQGFADIVNTISDSLGGLGHIQGFDLSGMFGGAGASTAKGSIDGIKGSLEGVATVGESIKRVWDGVLGVFHSIGEFLQPLMAQFGVAAGFLKTQLGNLFEGKELNFDDFLGAIQTGLFLAIFLQIRNFVKSLNNVTDAASGVLKQVTGNLKSMQAEVRAAVILQIAVALVLLAGAVYLLAQTDPKSLGLALGAVVAMLTALVAAMKLLEKSMKGVGDGAKLAFMAAGMVLMAVAIAAMAAAVFLFGKMKPDEMMQGLKGVALALAVLTAAAAIMSKSGAGANMIGASIGLLIMSAALVALAGAIKLYSNLDPEMLTNGLIKVAAVIAVLALSMNLMRTGVSGAAAMFIVAAALQVLIGSIQDLAAMAKGDLLKAGVALAGMLLIIAGGMYLMQSALPGAAALLVIAAALTVLVPAMVLLGALPWDIIGKGLLVLGVIALALAAVAYVLEPVAPVLLALAAAVALLGAAVFLAGSGVLAFATALALFATNGKAGMAVFLDIIFDFIDALPLMVEGLGDTIDAIANLVGEKAPGLVEAFAALWIALIDAGIKVVPKIGELMSVLIKTALRVLVTYYDDLARAGLELIKRLLTAVGDAVPGIADKAGDLAIAFIKAMAKQAVRFANAAADALIDFLNGLADAITSHQTQLNNAGARVGVAIISGITSPLFQAGQQILDAINSAWNWAKEHFNPHLEVGGVTIIPRLGEQLTGTFAKLIGDTDQVTSALSSIKGQIHDTLESAKSDVDKWSSKLKELQKAKDKDPKAIARAKEMLDKATELEAHAEKATKAYKRFIKNHGDQLKGFAKDYTETLAKIEDAKKVLEDATNEQESFKASVRSTFGTLPDIDSTTNLKQYMKQLEQQRAKVLKFQATLAALKAAGLDDDAIRQFLAEGVDAQKVMDQLLAGGPEAMAAFKAANTGLGDAVDGLANMTSSMLGYDQAVANGKATLEGLTTGLDDPKSLANLKAQMEKIARIMMKAIKKELEVKSPSRKAAEVSKFFVMGLTRQMDRMHSDVAKSSAALGAVALDSLQETMSKLGDGVNGQLSMTPVISPVLDLTQLTRDANAISSLLATNPIDASVSFAQANDISTSRLSALEDAANSTDESRTGDIVLTQINQSPKALSDVEIYRQTKNLLSLTKEALQ